MGVLRNKNILLVVSGGIAAYKAPDVVRRLRDTGAEVRVVMTGAAQEFVKPLTFQAVSGQPVSTDLLDSRAEAAMGHIELARWASAVVIAPATANFIARLAHGQADDLAATVCLATRAPVFLAPAMNVQMYSHPATQENLATLSARGIGVIGPGAGDQACGETGPGRMSEAPEIVSALEHALIGGELAGTRVLITAGPTQEPIDPVRVLTNHSSGKMGFAVAEAARDAGAEVTLISGPTHLEPPDQVFVEKVITAQEMYQSVMRRCPEIDIFIGAAAVADYRAVAQNPEKIKKTAAALTLELVRNEDILAAVAEQQPGPFTVGFAAETEKLLVHARDKLVRKGIDMIAANWVGQGRGFNTDDNELVVVWSDGEVELDRQPKGPLARHLVAIVAERYRAVTCPEV